MALCDGLEAWLAALEADDGVRTVILWGGPDRFSAGFDPKEVLATDFRAFSHCAVESTERTYFFRKPPSPPWQGRRWPAASTWRCRET